MAVPIANRREFFGRVIGLSAIRIIWKTVCLIITQTKVFAKRIAVCPGLERVLETRFENQAVTDPISRIAQPSLAAFPASDSAAEHRRTYHGRVM